MIDYHAQARPVHIVDHRQVAQRQRTRITCFLRPAQKSHQRGNSTGVHDEHTVMCVGGQVAKSCCCADFGVVIFTSACQESHKRWNSTKTHNQPIHFCIHRKILQSSSSIFLGVLVFAGE
eukprot:Pompholyxophrys_punicea_v1_NODE_505_length_1822_cov_8.882286.p4 type:complete len:120 gc:universal NODE_505_length_1822_cov_8.882286:888-1247(+)